MFEFVSSMAQACGSHPAIATGAGLGAALLFATPFAWMKASTRRRIAAVILDDQDLIDWIGGEAYVCPSQFRSHDEKAAEPTPATGPEQTSATA